MSLSAFLPESWQAPGAFWRSRRNPSELNQILKIFLICFFFINLAVNSSSFLIAGAKVSIGSFFINLIIASIGCLIVITFFNCAVIKESIPLLVIVVIFEILVVIGVLFYDDQTADKSQRTWNLINAIIQGIDGFAYIIFGFSTFQGDPAVPNSV